jgi:hypothetical protein
MSAARRLKFLEITFNLIFEHVHESNFTRTYFYRTRDCDAQVGWFLEFDRCYRNDEALNTALKGMNARAVVNPVLYSSQWRMPKKAVDLSWIARVHTNVFHAGGKTNVVGVSSLHLHIIIQKQVWVVDAVDARRGW